MLVRLLRRLNLRPTRPVTRAARAPRFRPGVERLEGRDTPSLMGGPFQISHPGGFDSPSFAPATASSANGMSAVAWETLDTDVDHGEILSMQLFNADGSPRGGVIRVAFAPNEGANVLVRPALAMDNAGNTIVAWAQSSGNSPFQQDVYAARYDANGNRLTGVRPVLVAGTALNESDPSVAVSGDGTDILITYSRDASAGNADVIGRRFTAAFGAVSSFFVANTPANEFRARAARGTDPDNRFAIAYEVGADVVLKRYAGIALLGTDVVASGPRLQQVPRLDVDNAGNAVVVWQEYWDGQWNIFGRRVAAGGAMDPTFAVITTARDETLASVAVNKTTGAFVVTFQSREAGTSGPTRVYVMEFTAAGSRTATFNLGEQFPSPNAAVSIDGAGRYLVVYLRRVTVFDSFLGHDVDVPAVFGQYGVL